MSGGEPHDHHRLRDPEVPHTNFVIKQNGECESKFGMPTSFEIKLACGNVDKSFNAYWPVPYGKSNMSSFVSSMILVYFVILSIFASCPC